MTTADMGVSPTIGSLTGTRAGSPLTRHLRQPFVTVAGVAAAFLARVSALGSRHREPHRPPLRESFMEQSSMAREMYRL